MIAIKRHIFISLVAGQLFPTGSQAQTSKTELKGHPELASSNYCNYPQPIGHITPPPSGYEPSYVSHYGRHGARYMSDDNHYKYVIVN